VLVVRAKWAYYSFSFDLIFPEVSPSSPYSKSMSLTNTIAAIPSVINKSSIGGIDSFPSFIFYSSPGPFPNNKAATRSYLLRVYFKNSIKLNTMIAEIPMTTIKTPIGKPPSFFSSISVTSFLCVRMPYFRYEKCSNHKAGRPMDPLRGGW
jgi:hypothetical protein